MTRVMGLITARGGSKGVPRKNVRLLAGKPLIVWTIEAAQAARRLDRLIVSTDDADIAELCRSQGVEVPFLRPGELAGDASPHADVVLHAIEWMRDHAGYLPDYLVLLQPTSPLRIAADIDSAVEIAIRRQTDAVISVTPTHNHPCLVRQIDEQGLLQPFVPCELANPRRQDLPPSYALNGAVFVYRVATILQTRSLACTSCLAYVMPEQRSLQIDTPWEFLLCDLVARHTTGNESLNTASMAVIQPG